MSKPQKIPLTVEARVNVPLDLPGAPSAPDAEGVQVVTQFVAFAGIPDAKEHVAIVFQPSSKTPLVRIHSECLTGDVFHSLRCDCRAQLEETIRLFSEKGGILLYLRQEGRGVGLNKKLQAYELQDKGFDTYEANRELGLEEDARDYSIAADMLRALDIAQVHLVSNNPEKANSLKNSGISIAEVIPTRRHTTRHNERYLKTKEKHGHAFKS